MKYIGLITLICIILSSGHRAISQPTQLPSSTSRVNETVRPIYKDRIVAQVNEKIITLSEVARLTRQVQQKPELALRFLVREKLVLQAAQKEGVRISDDELQSILDQRIKKLGGEEQFRKIVLNTLKISREEYQVILRRDLIMQKYIMKRLMSNPLDKSFETDFIIDTFVTPKEIRDYFEANQLGLIESPKIRTRQIILLFENSTVRASKQTLGKAILKELTEGTDFASLAREYSEIKQEANGLWEWTPPHTFPPEVETIIWSLEAGQISPLIETKKSFRVIKIEDKITSHKDFSSPELQARIKNILINDKYKKGQIKIIEMLLKKANIWVDPALSAEDKLEDTAKPH